MQRSLFRAAALLIAMLAQHAGLHVTPHGCVHHCYLPRHYINLMHINSMAVMQVTAMCRGCWAF